MKHFVLPLIVTPLLAASAWAWIEVFLRWRQGLPLVAWTPRSHVPWQGSDLMVIVVLTVALLLGVNLVQSLGFDTSAFLHPERTSTVEHPSILVLLVTECTAILLSVAYLRCVCRATWKDLGWDLSHVWADLRLGFWGFALLTPPVYLLQQVLVQTWKESRHPLVEQLQETRDWQTFLACTLAAVVLAPIVEEFAFRVLFQGWLERHRASLTPQPKGADVPSLDTPSRDVELSVAAVEHDFEYKEYLPESKADLDESRERYGARAWPIVVSSFCFALAHWSHGPDPIPLFLFALGLGYLYQRTHRIMPCLVMHASLNGVSMVLLGLYLVDSS